MKGYYNIEKKVLKYYTSRKLYGTNMKNAKPLRRRTAVYGFNGQHALVD